MAHHTMERLKPTGIPWLRKPLLLHSSREDKCKLTPAQCEYRSGHWRNWYVADLVYARGTVYFLCAIVAVFMIAHLFRKLIPPKLANGLFQKPKGFMRYLVYRGFRIPSLSLLSPNVGGMLVVSLGILFFSALTLGPKPYYWPNTEKVIFGNSPPIAIRAGWMALGLLPFVIVLAAKTNWITMMTGVPHEKLQIFHQWTSWAMFTLGLIHMFPFIIYQIRHGDIAYRWSTSAYYWTGVVVIIAQAYLNFMSLPVIRKKFYELFKATHFFAAVVFVVFFFIHCGFRLTSWDYFIATAAVYLPCLVIAQIRTFYINRVCLASIDVLPCGLIRIKIPCMISWKAGQHVFVRFLGMGAHSLTAHPFTIASLPRANSSSDQPNDMVIYVKRQEGTTKSLLTAVQEASSLTMGTLIEGPYGGVCHGSGTMAKFDTILVIAGGSGAGFSFTVVEDVLRHVTETNSPGRTAEKTLKIIYAAHSSSMAQWYDGEIRTMLSRWASSLAVSVLIHTTSNGDSLRGSEPQLEGTSNNDDITDRPQNARTRSYDDIEKGSVHGEKNENSQGMIRPIIHLQGRPSISSAVASLTDRAAGKTIGIAVCGPSLMIHDVRNAAAEAQRSVLAGHVKEVFLHTESFSL